MIDRRKYKKEMFKCFKKAITLDQKLAIRNFPEYIEEMKKWIKSDHRPLHRADNVMLTHIINEHERNKHES